MILNDCKKYIEDLGCSLIEKAGSGSLYYEYNSLKTGKVYIRISDHISKKTVEQINIIHNKINDIVTIINKGFVFSGTLAEVKVCIYTLIMSNVNGTVSAKENKKNESAIKTEVQLTGDTITEKVNAEIKKEKAAVPIWKYDIIDTYKNHETLSLLSRKLLEDIIDKHPDLLTDPDGTVALRRVIFGSCNYKGETKLTYINKFFDEYYNKSITEVVVNKITPEVVKNDINKLNDYKVIKIFGDKLRKRIEDFFVNTPAAEQDVYTYLKTYASARLEHKIFKFDELERKYA